MSDRPSAAARRKNTCSPTVWQPETFTNNCCFRPRMSPPAPRSGAKNCHPVLCCFHPRPIPATRNCSSAFLQPETLFLVLSDFYFYARITSPLGALLLRVTSRITYLRSYHYLTAAMAIGWALRLFPNVQDAGLRLASAGARLRHCGPGLWAVLATNSCSVTAMAPHRAKKQLLVHPSPCSKAKTTNPKPLRNWKPSKNSCCFSLFCTSPLHCFLRLLQRHQKNRSVVVSQPETLWKQLLSPLHRPPHRGIPKPECFFKKLLSPRA